MLYDPKWQKPAFTITPWRQLLLDAADVLERRGHAKDQLVTDDGRVCLIGAIHVAQGGEFNLSAEKFDAKESALVVLRKVTGGNIVDWNRAPGRTGAEAVAVLRSAARL